MIPTSADFGREWTRIPEMMRAEKTIRGRDEIAGKLVWLLSDI
jgi:hypothetical protein